MAYCLSTGTTLSLSDKNNGNFTRRSKCVFESISLCPLLQCRQHTGVAMGTKPWPSHLLISQINYLNALRMLRCAYISYVAKILFTFTSSFKGIHGRPTGLWTAPVTCNPYFHEYRVCYTISQKRLTVPENWGYDKVWVYVPVLYLTFTCLNIMQKNK
jgi:hypothetical protein